VEREKSCCQGEDLAGKFQWENANAYFCVCKERCHNCLSGNVLLNVIKMISHREVKPTLWQKSEDACAAPTEANSL